MMKRFLHTILALSLAVSCGSGDGMCKDSFIQDAEASLKRLDLALVNFQNSKRDDPDFGGLLCPRCHEYHSRSAEAVFPLAYEASLRGDESRAEQALMLGDWLLGKQNEDGSWFESERTRWRGTTADQLLSLCLAYPLLEEHMSALQSGAWKDGIRRASDFLLGFMDIRVAYINYLATSSAALAEASILLKDSRYADGARELARFCISQINEDGLLEGEGEWNGTTKTGIDIGYNMEMSLWGLLRYARLCGDRVVEDAVLQSAEAHSWFLYPDGTLDCSEGLRSCKWTLYGSSTADGYLPLCSMLSADSPTYAKAASNAVHAIGRCVRCSGLLAPGPDYDGELTGEPCIYHSFAKAKGLAMALAWQEGCFKEGEALWQKDTLVQFKTLGTVIVRKGPVRASICAYSYKSAKGAGSRFMHRPSGGAMTLLWKDGQGLLQASSPNSYRRWEDSFPELDYEPRPATSRIELVKDGTVYTNLYEYDARIAVEGGTTVEAAGLLKDENGVNCGVSYELDYVFDGSGLTEEITVHGADAVFIEAVLDPEGSSRQYYPSIRFRETGHPLRDGQTLKLRY